ncbi:Major facilitator superfamily (MFS) profile domain-containing protein [Plasmodiophora brassicae]
MIRPASAASLTGRDVPEEKGIYDSSVVVRVCLWAVHFCDGMQNMLIIGLLEDLVRSFPESASCAKSALGISYLVASAVSNPIWGWICDRHGLRVGIITGLVLSAIGSGTVALSRSLWVACLGRALSGMSANLSLNKAYLGIITCKRNQGAAFGALTGSFGLAITITPLLCPALRGLFPEQSVAFGIGAFASLAALLTLAVCVVFLPDVEPDGPPGAAQRVRSLTSDPFLSRYRLPLVAACTYIMSGMLLQIPDLTLTTAFVRKDRAYFFAGQGLVRTLSTIFLFPVVVAAFGVVRVTQVGLALSLVQIPVVYLASLIDNDSAWYLAQAGAFCLRALVVSMTVTGAAVVVNNASSASTKARAVSFTQSAASLTGVGVTAALSALLDAGRDIQLQFLPFLVLLGVAVVTVGTLGTRLPPVLNEPRPDRVPRLRPPKRLSNNV